MATNRKRTHYFAIRLSDDEQKLWEKKQLASGLSKTEYFIRLLKSSTIKVYDFDESLRNLYGELRKIGVNLNQIAYHANAGFLPQAESELRNIHAIYSDVMERLTEFLERPLLNARIFENSNGGES